MNIFLNLRLLRNFFENIRAALVRQKRMMQLGRTILKDSGAKCFLSRSLSDFKKLLTISTLYACFVQRKLLIDAIGGCSSSTSKGICRVCKFNIYRKARDQRFDLCPESPRRIAHALAQLQHRYLCCPASRLSFAVKNPRVDPKCLVQHEILCRLGDTKTLNSLFFWKKVARLFCFACFFRH